MGKQISFLMDDYDEERFFNFVSENGIIYEGIHYTPTDQLPLKFSENGWYMLYLLEKKNQDTFINTGDWIDPYYEPVIEWSRTIVNVHKNHIVKGRLWLEMNFYALDDDEGIKLRKEESLDLWYKQLVKWIKKNLSYYYHEPDETKYYISSSLIPLLEKGFEVRI